MRMYEKMGKVVGSSKKKRKSFTGISRSVNLILEKILEQVIKNSFASTIKIIQ